MQSDSPVTVVKTDGGWLFDGPSDDVALIFYPGARVEETAYAPLLRRLAEEKMDVCLVKMPFRLAFFGMNKAGKIMAHTDYSRFYIGGHSLGGAMAASYAAGHESDFSGLILLASYPTDETGIDTLLIYGSEDEILNVDRFTASLSLLSGRWEEAVIDGGNHAGFGNYGSQKGDGKAGISPLEQQEKTIEYISEFVKAK
ncbi:MAG: alpha/beta hydrolase [Eubacterium sp.]|nr:alpha/beta hydrolase [Eubacterium sp.]